MMKRCPKCEQTKPLSEFHRSKGTKNGHVFYCKQCVSMLAKLRNSRPESKEAKRIYDAIRRANPDLKKSISIQGRKYYQKLETKVAQRERNQRRRREDAQFKIACCLRSRLYAAIRKDFKAGSAVHDLGCSIDEFKVYLEAKFQPDMTWRNYGRGIGYWSIDHVMPLTAFDLTDRQHVLLACFYMNLQPLWYEENSAKGARLTVGAARK